MYGNAQTPSSCEPNHLPMDDQTATSLSAECAAATAELNAATAMTTQMLVAGIPLEHLEAEFLAEERARRNLEAASRRIAPAGDQPRF